MKRVLMLLANGVEPLEMAAFTDVMAWAIFVDRPVVIDGNHITSTGPGTALEVALELLGLLTDRENARDLRIKMRIPEPVSDWYQNPQVPQ